MPENVTISQAEYDRLRAAAEEAKRLLPPAPVDVPADQYGAMVALSAQVEATRAAADAGRPAGIDPDRWSAWHQNNPGKTPQWADVALMVEAQRRAGNGGGYGLTYRPQ